MTPREIETARFGRIRPSRAARLTIPEGMLGFPGYTRFALLAHPGREDFAWLQSLEDGALAFPVTNPRRHLPEITYSFSLQDLEAVGLAGGVSPEVLVTVTVPSGGGIRLNLSGPILVNFKKRLARQLVLPPAVSPDPVCYSSPGAEAKAS